MHRAYLLNLPRTTPAIVINWNRRTLHFSPASLRMQVRMGPWRTAPVHRSIYPQIKAGFVHRHGDVPGDAFASGNGDERFGLSSKPQTPNASAASNIWVNRSAEFGEVAIVVHSMRALRHLLYSSPIHRNLGFAQCARIHFIKRLHPCFECRRLSIDLGRPDQ